jgi:peptidoglycan/xylan/chitin deacetylase (PgdA/CDA1 family)
MFRKANLINILVGLRIHDLMHCYKAVFSRGTILCFHRVSNEEIPCFAPMIPSNFERVLQYVSERYTVVTLREMFSGMKFDKPPLVLSFDDGFSDFYENVVPLLSKYQLSCNLNVVIQCLDGRGRFWTQRIVDLLNSIYLKRKTVHLMTEDINVKIDCFERVSFAKKSSELFEKLKLKSTENINRIIMGLENQFECEIIKTRMMDWDSLLAARRECRIEIGSHSISHPFFESLSNEEACNEIKCSKNILENRLGETIEVFCFPNGSSTPENIQACYDAGYRYVLGTKSGLVGLDCPNLLLNRISVYHGDLATNQIMIENFRAVVGQNSVVRFFKGLVQ